MAGQRILIIDDEADIREVAQMSLEMQTDWQVFQADSGPAGLAWLADNAVEGVLLDLMMPGMDGLATLEHLRQRPAGRDLPVILLTARTAGINPARLATLGVAGVLEKPFDPLGLAAQIGDLLDWSAT